MHDNLGPKNFRTPIREEEPFFEGAQDPHGEEERWWWIFQNPLGVIIMIALAIVLVIGLWFIFKAPSSKQWDSQNGVVVVKSDGIPYKEAPDESANQVVENQDKEVYKRLGQSQSEEKDADASVSVVEEKPLDSHEFPETPKEEKKGLDQPSSLRKVTEGVGVKMPAPVANEEFISEKKKTAISEETENQAIDVLAPKKAVEKPKAVKGLTAGSYVIRVASFRKQETADRELSRVVSSLGKLLDGVGRIVKKIESDSGAFYVVIVGGFSGLAKAKQMVKLLKDKNFDSVVQKVGG